jgi:tetratricopeptide (TPR) repeat protein
MVPRRFWSIRHVALGLAALFVLAGGAAWWYRVTRPDYLLRQGQAALARGDRYRAEEIMLRLEEAGHKEQAYLLHADLLTRSRQYRQALDELVKIGEDSDLGLRVQAAALAGWCWLSLGNFDDAASDLSFVLDHEPDNLRAHQGLADIYYHLGALAQAAGHFEAAGRLDPQDGRPYQYLGYIAKDLDHKPEAIEAYQEALRRGLKPEAAAGVRQELAELLVGQGRYAEAEEVLDSCDPRARDNEPVLLALRAECHLGQNRSEEARALLDRALAAHPRSVELLRGRAKLHLAAGEYPAAAELLEQAVALDKNDLTSRHQLAQAYEALGRSANAAEQRRLHEETQKALDELTKLSQEAMKRPWDAAVRRRLAKVCQQLGKADLATMWLEAADACPAPPPGSGGDAKDAKKLLP